MDWEVVSDDLEVKPLIKEKSFQVDSDKEETSDNELGQTKNITNNDSSGSDEESETPSAVRRLVHSQKKIFKPTPSPPPLESEDDEEMKPCPKNSTLVKFIYLGFAIYLLSEYSKQFFVEKKL